MLLMEQSHPNVLSQRGSKDMVSSSTKALWKAGRWFDGGWAPEEKQTWSSKAAVEGRGRVRVPLPVRCPNPWLVQGSAPLLRGHRLQLRARCWGDGPRRAWSRRWDAAQRRGVGGSRRWWQDLAVTQRVVKVTGEAGRPRRARI